MNDGSHLKKRLRTALILAASAFRFVPAAAAELSTSESIPLRQDEAQDANENVLRQSVVLVVGASGTEEYRQMFHDWAESWREAAELGAAEFVRIGDGDDSQTDRDRLRKTLADQSERSHERLWIVLIGHGTYDGQAAKFNLRGPDMTAEELASWLEAIESPTVVINCASSSAPFMNSLSTENRVIVTATRSGYELNFARFGGYLADAISDHTADLDKDDQVSLLEAFLTACRQVQEFYEQDARLMTEHALLDDNGDGLGTAASWFRGLRATKRAKEGAALDGLRAHQLHLIVSQREARMSREARQQRDALEREIAALRDEKPKLEASEYYKRLESIMVELARLYLSPDGETVPQQP